MSTALREMMERRASDLQAPGLEPGPLLAAAQRRVRRRRVGMGGGVAALGLVGTLLLPGLTGTPVDRDSTEGRVATGRSTSQPFAWAVGSTLHTEDGGTVDLRREPVALVQGPSGFVFADSEGEVSVVVDGEVTPVGRFRSPGQARFVADGDLVAWVDAADEEPAYMVVDLSQGNGTGGVALPVSAHEAAASALERELGEFAAVAAVDGESVYLRTEDGADLWRPLSGSDTITRVPVPEGTAVNLHDVKDGVFHYLRRAGTPARKDEEYVVGPDLASGPAIDTWDGILSPDGRFLISETADENRVVDTATGELLPFDAGPYGHLNAYRWLDSASYAALGIHGRSSTTLDLLRCEVLAGTCQVAVPDLDTEGLVLPTGTTW